MKPNIHPEYNQIKVIISQDEFETKSTLKAKEILMDVDFRKHPAWNKENANFINQSNKSVVTFNKKFSGLSFNIK